MNHCRFLDHLTDCERYFGWWPKTWNRDMRPAPVFIPPDELTWDLDLKNPDVVEELRRLWSEDQQLHLPFNVFKMHSLECKVPDPAGGSPLISAEQWLCLKSFPGGVEIVVHVMAPPLKATPFVIKRAYRFNGFRECGPELQSTGLYGSHSMHYAILHDETNGGIVNLIPHLRDARTLPKPQSLTIPAWSCIAEILQDFIPGSDRLLQYMTAFAWHLSHSDNVILKREPIAPCKSVQWRQARTVFTIVHRKVAGVMQRGGSEADVKAEITRCAHERRGHSRKLQSPRYKKMQGRTIWIRPTWVGPTEWRDQRGEHYYSITGL